jgi:hypothetical protein
MSDDPMPGDVVQRRPDGTWEKAPPGATTGYVIHPLLGKPVAAGTVVEVRLGRPVITEAMLEAMPWLYPVPREDWGKDKDL